MLPCLTISRLSIDEKTYHGLLFVREMSHGYRKLRLKLNITLTAMLKSRHTNAHPLLKIVEWLMIMLACTLIVFGAWYMLPVDHASTGSLLLFQALQAVAVFIIPALAVAYLWSDQPLQWLHIRAGDQSGLQRSTLDVQLSLLSIGIIVTAIPLINCLVSWNRMITLPDSLSSLEQLMQQLEEQAERLLEGFLTYRDGAWWMLVVNLFVLALLPAIGEELAFRGVLQSLISGGRSGIRSHVAVWVTAFVFSFVHFQFYGFIPRLLLGALLGYALAWSGRIGHSIIMHATNNALSVIVFYLGIYVLNYSQAEIDALGTDHTWWLTLVCTPAMAGLMYLYYRRSRSLQKRN